MFAELLRLRGEFLLLGEKSDSSRAEDDFRKALDCVHRQGALSWELRAATSLGRLLRDEGRAGDAIAVVQSVYD